MGNMNDKYRNKLIFVLTVALITVAIGTGGMIVKELTDDKPSQALCDDMFDLMSDPVHTKLHEDYVETMQLLHLFIEECHANGNYDEDYDPNAMIGMNMTTKSSDMQIQENMP